MLCVAFGPALVALGARWLLAEPLPPRKVAFVMTTVLGLLLVALARGQDAVISSPALVWGLVAALTVASYDLVGTWLLRRYRPVTLSAF